MSNYVYMLIAVVVGFGIALICGKLLIPELIKLKIGQRIREDGPTWHMGKTGTPTMGGFIFIIPVALISFILGIPSMLKGDFRHIFVLIFACIFSLVGFLDDYEKVKKKQNLGLKAYQKIIIQLAISIIFIILMRKFGYISEMIYIPFFNVFVFVPLWVYCIFAAFIIIGSVNAVNITDGVDGLCAGVTIPVCLFFAVVSLSGEHQTVGIFSMALAGALGGFLVYNFHPAKVFMGDTGSMFLGGAVCALAFALDMPLILITVGIIYVCEAMSDIIQTCYFKITHGKRIFKMAPIHHHFEMSGWSEVKIFVIFTLISVIFGFLSYIGVMGIV